MSTSTDTFVTFVDNLASSLDGHAPRTDEVAARAYFSRSHFDRIVSAAAGELIVRAFGASTTSVGQVWMGTGSEANRR